MTTQMIYVQVPRVTCEYPVSLDIPRGSPVPVRMRDDLDPCAPPAEYADGRISWSGYRTREERDEARVREAEEDAEERRRADAARRALSAATERQIRSEIASAMAGHDHKPVTDPDSVSGFMGPVAGPDGDENPAAHGNICVTQRCRCGAAREVLINGLHEELGPWGIDKDAVAQRLRWRTPCVEPLD